MYYFRFKIPKMANGIPIKYSSGWHGTMPKCPKDVIVLLYNDEAGYGLAQSQDTFVPPEVTLMTKDAVDELPVTPGKAVLDGR